MNPKQITSIVFIILLVLNLVLFTFGWISNFFFWINILIIFLFTKFYMNKKE